MMRQRASPAKVAVGIAVLDVWRVLNDFEDPDSAMSASAASLASIGIATRRLSVDSGDVGDIVRECRRRIEASVETGGPWEQLWKLANEIGDVISFFIDVEAARADRLWASLITFAAPEAPIDLGPVPATALPSLLAVEKKIRATDAGALDSIRFRLASTLSLQPKYEMSVPNEASVASVPEWTMLDPAGPYDDARRVRVWFGTNREPTSKKDLNSAYSNRLAAGELYYGVCQVNIPRMKRLSGGIRPFASKWLRRGAPRGGSRVERYYRFDGPDGFLSAFGSESAQAPSERTGLVFIHGFATSFTDAATTAAELSLHVKHRGPTAMFTWASKGRADAYGHDERVVQQSRQQLIDFLVTLSARAGLEHIDLVVHSLGNRLLLRSLVDWFGGSPPDKIPLRNLYLGAPDVDQPEFLHHANIYARAGTKTTLYASNSDTALLASVIAHRGVHRAGLMPPVVTARNIDTIETSAVNFSAMGHAYIIDSSAIRADIFSVQSGILDPASRANIHLAGSSQVPDYWRFD
jgi:esterase/lipase superfamily enzyme